MAKAGAVPAKESLNAVHKNAILCETVSKEARHQKLFTHYGVNPFTKSKFFLKTRIY